MEQSDLLRQLVDVVERLGVPYLITGSMATVYFGEPRLTNDIDVVMTLRVGQIAEFCRAFPAPEFCVSESAAREAVATGGQFNIIHPASGLKIDVMVSRDTAFDRSRFARVQRLHVWPDRDASFASPEDVIIKKMEWYREGESEKHLRDIAGVMKISGERIDRSYIAEWASRLGLTAIWQSILERVDGRPDSKH